MNELLLIQVDSRLLTFREVGDVWVMIYTAVRAFYVFETRILGHQSHTSKGIIYCLTLLLNKLGPFGGCAYSNCAFCEFMRPCFVPYELGGALLCIIEYVLTHGTNL